MVTRNNISADSDGWSFLSRAYLTYHDVTPLLKGGRGKGWMQMVILTLDQDNSRIKILQLDIKLNNRTKIDNVHVASWLKI